MGRFKIEKRIRAATWGTICTAFALLMLGSCSTAKKNGTADSNANDQKGVLVAKPGELYGPPASNNQNIYGPPAAQNSNRPIVLVLAPAFAHAYSYLGVLKVLQKEKITISAIYATQVGALIAAAFAAKPNVNALDWSLQRLSEEALTPPQSGGRSGWLKLGGEPDHELQKALKNLFGQSDLSQYKIPVLVGVQQVQSGEVVQRDQGVAAAVVRAAFAGPTGWEPREIENGSGKTYQSSAFVRPFPIEDARLRGAGSVVVVADASTPESYLKDADLVVRIDFSDLTDLDFNRKTDLVFRGRKAAEMALPEIRRWTTGIQTQ